MRAGNKTKIDKENALGGTKVTSIIMKGLTGLASVALLAGPAFMGQAAATETLRLSHFLPPQHPVHGSIEDWATSINEDSGGELQIQIFPAQQLGAAFDHYNLARDGIADIAAANPGYQPGRFPIAGAIELPLTLSNATGGSHAVDEWYRQYAATDMPDVHFCLATIHQPASFHTAGKAIVEPKDVEGLRVRTGNATIAQFVKELGGSNIQGSTAEVKDILQKGVADSVIWPWGSVILFGVTDTVDHHLEIPLSVSSLMFVVNKDKYESLSDSARKVLDDHCTSEWAEKIATPWANFEAAGVGKIEAMDGHTIERPSEAQMAAWQEAAKPIVDSWAETVAENGGDPDEILSGLRETAAKYNAAAQ